LVTDNKSNLKTNINRLLVVLIILASLKLFTYAVQEFLPVFTLVLGKIISAFLPFILALILAFLIEPFVLKTIKLLRIKRGLASVLVIIVMVLLFLFCLMLIGIRLYKELAGLGTTFPAIYQQSVTLLTEKVGIIQKYLELNPQIQASLKASTQEIINSLQFILKELSMGLLAFLGALPGIVTVTVITVIATLLTSMNYPVVKEWFFQKVKGKHVLKTKMVASDLGKAMVGFLRAQVFLVILTMFITTAGLLIIGHEYSFTIGILTGLLDLVPIVGPAIIFIPWGLVLLITGSVVQAVKILLIYAVATVVRRIVEPKILADNIGIHPLPTLISMYAGLTLFGAWGLILGPAAIIVYESMRKAGFFRRDKKNA